ncbi:MAG: transcription negative regulator ChrR [Fibrobacteres bacterium]|nr:transcription negative regulator ChrR [Fibrobacterota bacterium]
MGAFRITTGLQGPEGGDPAWKELRPGVHMRTLFAGGPGEYHVELLHYRPGAYMLRHEHLGDEHIFVLQGSQGDEHGNYGAGSYVYNPAGSFHAVRSEEGCLVLVHRMAPVRFTAKGE